jgi:hypothetical protein
MTFLRPSIRNLHISAAANCSPAIRGSQLGMESIRLRHPRRLAFELGRKPCLDWRRRSRNIANNALADSFTMGSFEPAFPRLSQPTPRPRTKSQHPTRKYPTTTAAPASKPAELSSERLAVCFHICYRKFSLLPTCAVQDRPTKQRTP